jgi:methionyl-tRNA formyltransferase
MMECSGHPDCGPSGDLASRSRDVSASSRPHSAVDKLRIAFLTQDDPLYILPFFEEFFRNYASDFDIASVSCSPVMGKRSRSQLLKELFWLYGSAGLARLISRAATSRALGRLPKKQGAATYYSLFQLCRAYSVPFASIGNPNDDAFVARLEECAPEAIVSVACPYILKERLLRIPKYGCINIHHAPLPRYKGMMPTFWQMYHGERRVGVTIHYMVAQLDAGPVLLQSELDIEPNVSLDSMIRRSKRHGAHCMAQVLRQLQANEQHPVMLDNSKGTYFTFPTRDEIREFRRRGLRAI